MNELTEVERRVLGALLKLSDNTCIAKVRLKDIADELGYKKPGGTITYALRLLEKNNYIIRMPKKRFKVLI